MYLFSFFLGVVLAGIHPVIESLVKELGSDDFDRRERATAVLDLFGSLAYRPLKTAEQSQDAEVNQRARRLIRRMESRALAQAADREVVIKPTDLPLSGFGTIVSADGEEALILTSISVSVMCNHGAVIRWSGKEFVPRLVATDEDLGLALYTVPCRKALLALPLASGRTKGCWWNSRLELDLEFKEDMELAGPEAADGDGCAVFALSESDLQLMLAGVNDGYLLKNSIPHPWTPGPERIRQFLANYMDAKKSKN